jgi:hypothetical protein
MERDEQPREGKQGMGQYTFYDVNLRDTVDVTSPVSTTEISDTTWQFAQFALGTGGLIALSILSVAYIGRFPELSWLVPVGWAISGLGLWLAFVGVTQFLNAQYVMMETFSQWQLWQETRRRITEAAARPMTIQTNVDARGVGNAVAVHNTPIVQENIRIVPVHTPHKLIDGIPEAALAFFIDQYEIRSWSQRDWVDQGIRLPGMKEPVDYDIWRQLIGEIEKVEGIPPVKERVKIKPILPLETIKRKLLSDGSG